MHKFVNPDDQVIVDVKNNGKLVSSISIPWYVDWAGEYPYVDTFSHKKAIVQMAIDKVNRAMRGFQFLDTINQLHAAGGLTFTISLNDKNQWNAPVVDVEYVIEQPE